MHQAVSDVCLNLSLLGLFTSPSLNRRTFNPVSCYQLCQYSQQVAAQVEQFPSFSGREFFFKKALCLPLSMYGLPMLLMFCTCPVPLSPPWQPFQIHQVQAQVLLVHVGSLIWLIHQLFHFHQFPCVRALLLVRSCCIMSVLPGTDGSPRIIWNLSESCQGVLWLLDCWKEYGCSYQCSPFLYSPLCKS